MRCAKEDNVITNNLGMKYDAAAKSACVFEVIQRLYEMLSPIYHSGRRVLSALADAGDLESIKRLSHTRALESVYHYNIRMLHARTGASSLKIRSLETAMRDSFSTEEEITEFLEGFGLRVCELRVDLREVIALARRILSILFSLDLHLKRTPLEFGCLPCSASTVGSHILAYSRIVVEIRKDLRGRIRRGLKKPSGKIISLQAWKSAC